MIIPNHSTANNNSGMQATKFTLSHSAHFFKILSSSLYSNKEEAVLREVSANASDAHTEAGIPEVPIVVDLPTVLNPVLSITDKGNGMSVEELHAVYTVYGASTKASDNSLTGGFGLGSKSPFALTEAFNVTSTKDGTTTTISCYLDGGVPNFVVLNSVEDGKDSGTTVTIPVSGDEQHTRLKKAAAKLFTYWNTTPDLRPTPLPESSVHFGDKLYLRPEPPAMYRDRQGILSEVVIGEFAYAVPEHVKEQLGQRLLKDDDWEEMAGTLGTLHDTYHFDPTSAGVPSTVLKLDIGALELAPSRERIEATADNADVLYEAYKAACRDLVDTSVALASTLVQNLATLTLTASFESFSPVHKADMLTVAMQVEAHVGLNHPYVWGIVALAARALKNLQNTNHYMHTLLGLLQHTTFSPAEPDTNEKRSDGLCKCLDGPLYTTHISTSTRGKKITRKPKGHQQQRYVAVRIREMTNQVLNTLPTLNLRQTTVAHFLSCRPRATPIVVVLIDKAKERKGLYAVLREGTLTRAGGHRVATTDVMVATTKGVDTLRSRFVEQLGVDPFSSGAVELLTYEDFESAIPTVAKKPTTKLKTDGTRAGGTAIVGSTFNFEEHTEDEVSINDLYGDLTTKYHTIYVALPERHHYNTTSVGRLRSIWEHYLRVPKGVTGIILSNKKELKTKRFQKKLEEGAFVMMERGTTVVAYPDSVTAMMGFTSLVAALEVPSYSLLTHLDLPVVAKERKKAQYTHNLKGTSPPLFPSRYTVQSILTPTKGYPFLDGISTDTRRMGFPPENLKDVHKLLSLRFPRPSDEEERKAIIKLAGGEAAIATALTRLLKVVLHEIKKETKDD